MSYPPPYYIDEDPDFARRIITDHGFALLIIEGLAATHLPLVLKNERDVLSLDGHIARQNPIAARLLEGAPVSALAVFSGPHAYVSASHYDDPARSVPTWNYASVQARGTLQALPSEAIPAHLGDLVRAYEGDDGWSVGTAPDYVATISQGIIAIRMTVTEVQAFRKMSGNKRPAIRKRIIDAARARGEDAFADEMETLR